MANVTSSTGNIDFDISSGSGKEMRLNSDGLAVGPDLSPSVKLHVAGNGIVTSSVSVGSSSQGSSNLMVHGSFGMSTSVVSSDTTLGSHSVVLAQSVSDNLVLSLPDPATNAGRVYWINKTISSNRVTVKASFPGIDGDGRLILSSGNLGYVKVTSDGAKWLSLSQSSDVTSDLVSTSNLIGYWNLDDTTGTSATDGSVTGNDGTLTNTTFDASSVATNQNFGIDLDGVNQHVVIPYDAAYEMDQLTVSIWAYSESAGAIAQIFTKDQSSGGTNRSWQFRKDSDEKIRFIVWNESSALTSLVSGNTISSSTWTHIAGTWDGTTVKIYIDGELDATTAFSGKLNKGETNDVMIGRSQNASASYFNGQLDEARIYNIALTADEISFLANP